MFTNQALPLVWAFWKEGFLNKMAGSYPSEMRKLDPPRQTTSCSQESRPVSSPLQIHVEPKAVFLRGISHWGQCLVSS